MVGWHISMYSKITSLELTIIKDHIFRMKYTFLNWPKSLLKCFIKFLSIIVFFPIYFCITIPMIIAIFLFIYTINFIPLVRHIIEFVFVIFDFIAQLIMILINLTQAEDYGYCLREYQASYVI